MKELVAIVAVFLFANGPASAAEIPTVPIGEYLVNGQVTQFEPTALGNGWDFVSYIMTVKNRRVVVRLGEVGFNPGEVLVTLIDTETDDPLPGWFATWPTPRWQRADPESSE